MFQVFVNMYLELVDALRHDRCFRKYIPVVCNHCVNEYFRISNIPILSALDFEWGPRVAKCVLSARKTSAGSIVASPLHCLNTSSRSALGRLVSRVVMFKALNQLG